MYRQIFTAPNQLTLLRLCMVPLLVIALLDGHYKRAVAIFVLAGISDGLDGLLARRFNQRTVLGQYLDPIADKLLLSTLFLTLTHMGLVPRKVTILVFSRDIGVLILGALMYMVAGLRDFSPSIFGKLNTLAQIIGVGTAMVAEFYAPVWIRAIKWFCLEATMYLTVISALRYVHLSQQRLDERQNRIALPGH